MARDISNSEDIMDSRDIIARIEKLEGERVGLESAIEEAETETVLASHGDGDTTGELTDTLDKAKLALAAWLESEEGEELRILRALEDEASGSPDWRHGETLIRDSYFCDYAEELARDICEMGKATDWPFRHIDWEAAAKELKQDYTEVDFDGVSYWIRS